MRRDIAFVAVLSFLALSAGAAASTCSADVALPQRGICAHRGANSTHPENTLPAFREAIRLGAHQIEFDVRPLKDGGLAVMHDPTVDRTTDGHGPVGGFTLDEIKKLDAGIKKDPKFAGTRVPTLAEALAVMPRNIWINLHLKGDASLGARVAQEVVRQRRTHQAFLACDHKMAATAHEVCATIMICNMERQEDTPAYVKDTIEQKAEFIQLIHQLPWVDEMAKLKAAGVRVNLFGTDDPTKLKTPGTFSTNDPAMLKTLYDAGVDFPLADKTAEMMEAARKLGIEPVKPAY
jgi:glycerophosphoryl diester phosphodiesterase